MLELKNKDDFIWHKKKLDLHRKYEHKHNNEPRQYPCRIISKLDNVSDYSSSLGAVDEYDHTFIYQEESVCSKCGHKELVWPSKEIEEIIDE